MNARAFEFEIHAVLGADVRVRDTGTIQRFATNGRRGDSAGWLVFFDTAGAFGDWRSGMTHTWSEQREMSPQDRRQLRRKIAQAKAESVRERDRKHQQTRQKAVSVWAKCHTPTRHPYLDSKRVDAHGIRQYGRFLIIPLADEAGGLWSLQRIAPDGTKRFMPGGRMKGYFHLIEGGERVGIAEGYGHCDQHGCA